MLIVGNDPQVLTLAYYALVLNPEVEVTVSYTRENKPFYDELLDIKPAHTERLVSSLGAQLLSIREVKLQDFDLIIDVMSYHIQDEPRDVVSGAGTIETLLATKRNLRLNIPRESNLVDKDMLKYIYSRLRDFIELSKDIDKPTVLYGVKHVNNLHCLYIGYGYKCNIAGITLEVTDPVYVYKQCIFAGIAIAMKLPLEELSRAPYWRSLILRDYVYFIFGPTSSQIIEKGKTPTSIPLTVDKCYLKLLCLYRQNIVGFQIAGLHSDVDIKSKVLYSLAVSSRDYSMLTRLVFMPAIPAYELRTWSDLLIEASIREMYWMFYA